MVFNAIAQGYFGDKERIKLKKFRADNKITTIYCYDFNTINKNTLKDSLLYFVKEYDSLGNNVHAKYYSTENKNEMEEECYYKYDIKNNLIEMDIVTEYEKYFYENFYDNSGNLVKVKCKDKNSKLQDISVYEYDKNSNHTSWIVLTKDSVLEEKITAVYNENNDFIKENAYDSLGILKRITVFKYNKNFQITGCIRIDPETNKIIERVFFKYKFNKIYKEIVYHSHSVLYYYNDMGVSAEYYYSTQKTLYEIRKYYYVRKK